MSEPLPLRVHRALDNPQLRVALAGVAQLGARRVAAFESLPDEHAIRDAARAARLDTLRDLPAQLERFEARAVANGAQVHWAGTAADAQRIIAGIAREAGARTIAKGKSMASEEIHLNEALEAAGLEVIETDLGEYIVQLAHDRPSHIVAPIIHMTRQQVGRVMHERLHRPLTDDPKRLGRYAREELRATFLRADVGLTGANFAIVETGGLCLVTNEGNGRMVTTLPRVHVALVGIEKVIPTLEDLDRFLKILARSATGQKLTAYTTMIMGPRRASDQCGPEAVHIVLLDNGRSRLLAGDCAEILGCIRCGACMNVCPVYTSIGGHAYGDVYPGPVGAVVTPGLRGVREWGELSGLSSLCGACRDVCPVRLDIPRMLLHLREAARPYDAPWWLRAAMRVYGALVARPGLFRMAARAARTMLRRQSHDGWLRSAPGPAAAWTRARDLHAPARVSFHEAWRAARKETRS